jgi:uridine phosphorylase
MKAGKIPHLVPSNLVGHRFARDAFNEIKIALVGYCPPPATLSNYDPVPTASQYFIHLSPDSVKTISYKGTRFLSLAHVYGGPVSASTVEELAYYDFDYILAYGLAGGLGTRGLRMGDFYLVESAFAADGTTPHYTHEPVVFCSAELRAKMTDLSHNTDLKNITWVRAYTGDAIYREDADLLQAARDRDCDVINLDSSHLYAVSIENHQGKALHTIECGVLSDVSGNDETWESSLAVMLSSQAGAVMNPLERTGKIVEFYVEQLAATLESKK